MKKKRKKTLVGWSNKEWYLEKFKHNSEVCHSILYKNRYYSFYDSDTHGSGQGDRKKEGFTKVRVTIQDI